MAPFGKHYPVIAKERISIRGLPASLDLIPVIEMKVWCLELLAITDSNFIVSLSVAA